jgi:tRNA-splicing ligase RtcB
MMEDIKDGSGGNRLPTKVWRKDFNDVEDTAWKQIRNLANLPFAFHHIAIMPDVHAGYGMCIGGVLATKGVIIPNSVGLDIGCGMCAKQLPFKVQDISKDKLKEIMGIIRALVPVGFEHSKYRHDDKMPTLVAGEIVRNEWQSASQQLGTLGGGNHFIEIQRDEEDNIWVMIHSGSRNLGKKVADFYNNAAKGLNERWFSEVDPKWDLAFLPLTDALAGQYLNEMNYCVAFALANRQEIMEQIIKAFDQVMNAPSIGLPNIEDMNGTNRYSKYDAFPMINIAHNYATMEHHFGSDVMVHRKGATLARLNTIGIIPGSQGTSSFVVRGLGNEDSFTSCSHGAGRKMGRKEAERTLSLEEQKKIMDDQGIIHGIRNASNLDEAPGAYKDIGEVMSLQADLVEIVHTLKPLAVIKGD